MTRIFFSLAVCGNAALAAAFWSGLGLGDLRVPDPVVQSRFSLHFLSSIAALIFAMLVHALVITYFMGTGRWLQETSDAYRLGSAWQARSRDLKWRLYPPLFASIGLLILTGAFGTAADPASAVGFQGFG